VFKGYVRGKKRYFDSAVWVRDFNGVVFQVHMYDAIEVCYYFDI
jgi:hypothetical protein